MASVPFPEDVQLIDKIGGLSANLGRPPAAFIPGKPSIKWTDGARVADYLKAELACPVIDELYTRMHLVARKAGSHVDTLHEHLLKGRCLKVTEDAGLHLVWYLKELYVKPLPLCLLSHAFWQDHLASQPNQSAPGKQYAAALGFVRSYAFLITHESDFKIAQKGHLLPKDLLYTDFAIFINEFLKYGDKDVSGRWHFGQIRLTRLNWAVRLLRPHSRRDKSFMQQLYYRERYWSITEALQQSAAPLIFLFASVSIILSAMQVVLAARTEDPWMAFVKASWGFSVAVILALLSLVVGALAIVLAALVWQMSFALGDKEGSP